jgi:hypothetical protein
MNFMNFRVEQNPNQPADWLVFGDIYDNDGALIADMGEDGTSVFAWWAQQDLVFQERYVIEFSTIMATQVGLAAQ